MEKYSTVKISTAIRSYLSAILSAFVARIAGLVLITSVSAKNKTVNAAAVLRTCQALLTDGHAAVESFALKEIEVSDPKVLKEEIAKRDEAKKAGEVYKIDMAAIPKTRGLAVEKTVTYPTSGYDALAVFLNEKLALLDTKEAAAVVEDEEIAEL